MCLAILLWFGCGALYEHYNQTRPAIENRTKGRVYVQNNHGHHAYLTAQEYYAPIVLGIVAGALFLTGAFIDPERRLWRWRARR